MKPPCGYDFYANNPFHPDPKPGFTVVDMEQDQDEKRERMLTESKEIQLPDQED